MTTKIYSNWIALLGSISIVGYILSSKPKYIPDTTYGDLGACTGSMRPTIVCGDSFVLGDIKYSESIQTGDIVVVPLTQSAIITRHCRNGVCQDNERAATDDPFSCYFPDLPQTVLHRVIAIHEQNGKRYLETKGDNNLFPERCYVDAVLVKKKLIGLEHHIPPINTVQYDILYDEWVASYHVYEGQLDRYYKNEITYDAILEEYDE